MQRMISKQIFIFMSIFICSFFGCKDKIESEYVKYSGFLIITDTLYMDFIVSRTCRMSANLYDSSNILITSISTDVDSLCFADGTLAIDDTFSCHFEILTPRNSNSNIIGNSNACATTYFKLEFVDTTKAHCIFM